MSTNGTKLDLTTHVRASKGGRIIETRPYRLHIQGGKRFFEMPKGSGQFFYENGETVPAADCPKLTPVVRIENEEQKLSRIRAQIAEEHAELERLQEQKQSMQGEGKAKATSKS